MSDKVGSMSEPTTLPPIKKRKTLRETTVSPSLSSPQDMDFEMVSEKYLGSLSQQDDPIEICHRAMAPCTESHTLTLFQVPYDILIEEIQDTVSREEFQLVIVPNIVTVDEPSHASEGKYDPMPLLQGPFSPLPEGTYFT